MAALMPSASVKPASAKPVDDSTVETVTQVELLYAKAKKAQEVRHDMWKRAYRLVHNRAWSRRRDPAMADTSASEIFPILAALVGWMTDQRVRFQITPAADPHSMYAEFMSRLAQDLENCMDSAWLTGDYDAEVQKALWDSLIYGTGIIKTSWDPAACDGAGNPTVARIDPFNIFVDPAGHNMEDINYILEVRRMSIGELERRWPKKGRLVAAEIGGGDDLPHRDDPFTGGAGKIPMANPGGITSDQGTGKPIYGLPGQSRKTVSADDESVVVYECWVKDNVLHTPTEEEGGDPYYTTEWRVIVTCGNHVLMDEKARDLWAHGSHPYDRYVQYDIGDFWGISLVDHLAPAQLAVNRLLAALQHHAELCGNPILLEDSRSQIPRTMLVNKPGQRVTKNAGSEVSWLVPPDMPPGVSQLVTFWINEMERISGLSAMVRGATPTGRNAQGVLDSVQESAFVRVRLALRNLERTLAKIGDKVANLIVENYDLPRTIAITGNDGQESMLALRSRHFMAPNAMGASPMKYSLYVRAGSSYPISRSARAQEADTLFAMGAIDDQAVLEAHDYPNRRQIIERVHAAQAAGVGMATGKKG